MIFIFGLIEGSVNETPSEKLHEMIRRIVSFLLPFVLLGFIMMFTGYKSDSANIKQFVDSIPWNIRGILGTAIGIGIEEFRKRLSVSSLDASVSTFILSFSSICAFLAFLLIHGVLSSFDFFLFGFYLAGGLWFIFRD